MPFPDSLHSPDITPSLSSVESLRLSIPESYQSLFDTLRREVRDFCDLHSIPTSSLNNDEALREATKHLSNSDLEHLSLVLVRLEYLVAHKEPMPEEQVGITEEQAREIMGKNFLGTKEVEEHFGELSFEQQEALSIIPFSKETLEACRETHILVADTGISILDICDTKTDKGKKLFFDRAVFVNGDFAKRIEPARWRLILKTPVEDSFHRPLNEQLALINQEIDEVPSARQLVYVIILHILSTKEWLFHTSYVRTSDVDSDGAGISVGGCSNGGIHVATHWFGAARVGLLGLSSSRKSS